MRAHPAPLSFLLLPALVCAACGAPSADLGAGPSGSQSSALRVTLSQGAQGASAPIDERFSEAVVVVHAVAVHVAGAGWQSVMEGRVEVDLLRLGDHATELGLATLPEGRVGQVRLYVLEDEDAYVVTADGERHPLRVPSGAQSGIKVKVNGSLGACEQATLDLELDGHNAIHIHGRGADDTYLFRPVIRAGRLAGAPVDGCEPGPGVLDPDGPDNPPPGGEQPIGDEPIGDAPVGDEPPPGDGADTGDGANDETPPDDEEPEELCFEPEAGYFPCPE